MRMLLVVWTACMFAIPAIADQTLNINNTVEIKIDGGGGYTYEKKIRPIDVEGFDTILTQVYSDDPIEEQVNQSYIEDAKTAVNLDTKELILRILFTTSPPEYDLRVELRENWISVLDRGIFQPEIDETDPLIPFSESWFVLDVEEVPESSFIAVSFDFMP
jgi:hypothetical protein